MKTNRILFYSLVTGCVLAAYGANAAVVKSGSCGGECMWELDDKGVFSTINGSTASGEFNIPEGTKEIRAQSFYGASGLTKITIPEGVTSIGGYAFYGASGIKSLTIPKGMTSIGDTVFGNMTGVTSLTIPDGVTSISSGAFMGMSNLTSLTIPDSVKWIDQSAFRWLSSVTGELKIPNSLTSIPTGAFYGMKNVTGELKIPESVTSIGNQAFYDLGGVTSLIIPDSVTSIGSEAFSGMKSLVDIFLSNDSGLTNEMLTASGINLNKIVRYTTDGKYLKDGKTYASLEDYRAGVSLIYDESKGKYKKMDKDGMLLNGYYNEDGSKIKYRIYSVSEAHEALGKNNKNTFSIRYR